MTRIDLLPPRYHRIRAFARQIYLVLCALAILTVVLGTALVAMKAQTTAYARMAAALVPTAGQYRTINARFDELQRAEKVLRERKEKATPLLERRGSVVPAVREFTAGLPSGTRLVALTVAADGTVSVKGESLGYNDVSRFVKWVGETLEYDQVALESVGQLTNGTVAFSLKAARLTGGEPQ